MRIRLASGDETDIRWAEGELKALLADAGLEGKMALSPPIPETSTESQKGDPVTFWTVVLAAVSVGGALTVAVDKEGFLTRLTRVLEKLADRKVAVTLEETPDGRKVSLSGSARQVERVLTQYMARPSDARGDLSE